MNLYHGTKRKFSRFCTPTGATGWNVLRGEVIYLTTDKSVAKKYAGRNGFILTCNAPFAKEYKVIRKEQGLPHKSNKYLRNVFVSPPEHVTIVNIENT